MKRLKKELKEIRNRVTENRKISYSKKTTINMDLDSCLCKDRNYQFKTLYRTQRDAERIAKFILDTQGVNLKIYPCPYSIGWHLTKY